jgi:arylsulfatase
MTKNTKISFGSTLLRPGRSVSLGALAIMTVASQAAAQSAAPTATAPQAQTFYGRTIAESSPPAWPTIPKAREGAPNVIIMMTDDVGFAASSTFGGLIPTPTFDALAATGLRYNRFHTTAVCSATRASLLTGREHHNANVGFVTNLPTGYEGYNGFIPASDATIPRLLHDAGYSTAMFGKAHITPESELSRAGPFDRWPTGLGFDYFYGFHGGDASMFAPALVENTTFLEPPHNDPSYHFDKDMADHAIKWVTDQKAAGPDRPFFLFYAPGSAHSPNHAPKEWLDKFRGKYDGGWDVTRQELFERQKRLGVIPQDAKLTPRPAMIPEWDSLSPDEKRVAARSMEAYAASLAFSDHEFGRLVDHLKAIGQYENTAIIYIQGDNGASFGGRRTGLLNEFSTTNDFPEDLAYQVAHIDEIGTEKQFSVVASGWAWAMNTPFPWAKMYASHFGGTRNGMAISWPAGIKAKGDVRSQFIDVSDILPTILELAGTTAPATVGGVAQKPLDGISFAYSFNAPTAPSRHRTQIFEVLQNMAIYRDGWIAATLPDNKPWSPSSGTKPDIDKRQWQLFDIDKDFSEADDLAAQNPAKLKELQETFWAEAARKNVLPIHPPEEGTEGRPSLTAGRTSFTYYPGTTRIPENNAPHVVGHSFTIDADLDGTERSNGVLATQGGRYAGYALYLHEGRPVFYYNAVGPAQYRVEAARPLTAGHHHVSVDFALDPATVHGRGGTATLRVDGKVVGQGRVERTFGSWLSHTEGLDIGEDTVTAINEDYTIPTSRFDGTLHSVSFKVQPN